jgi:hypothetical protein
VADPAPQGTTLVRSPPRGAGRRGRDDAKHSGGYDWDEIVAQAREVIAAGWWVQVLHVPYGSVDNLRSRYRDCVFRVHGVREWRSRSREAAMMVCDVYVKAGEDGDAEIESGDGNLRGGVHS